MSRLASPHATSGAAAGSSGSVKDRVSAEREAIPGENWVEKLRSAFGEVDRKNTGQITVEKWMMSRLRFLISSEIMSDERLKEFFVQIDANCDNIISWTELIEYLMAQQRSLNANNFDKKLRLVHVAPSTEIARKFRRTTRCLRSMYIHFIEQIVSLTESAMYFWTLDCELVGQFTDVGNFTDFCYVRSQGRLAITKENRYVIFYDLRTRTKCPFYLAASIETSIIPSLSYLESRDIMSKMKKTKAPLFHVPTAIEALPNDPNICVGDQEGRIELFKIVAVRGERFPWKVVKIGMKRVHKGCVTQIRYIAALDGFVSSGDDGSIAIWNFTKERGKFMLSYTFEEPERLPITSFVFDERTKSIIYSTPSHWFGCWKVFSTQRVLKETPGQMISAMVIVDISEDASFVVTVSEGNFIATYTSPQLEMTGSWFMAYHHNASSPASALHMNNQLFLVGNYISCWNCQTADSDGMKPHFGPLLGAVANDVFGRVVSCDEAGDILNWEFETGNKGFYFSFRENDSTVTSIQGDQMCRRLVVGYSNGSVKIISTNSGSILAALPKGTVDGGCNCAVFAQMASAKCVVVASGRKQVVIFDDVAGSGIHFSRAYLGHREHISKIINMKNSYILSMGMGRELFLWITKSQSPHVKFTLPNDPSCMADLPTPETFVVGDVAGYIHICSVSSDIPLVTVKPFSVNKVVPVTALTTSLTIPVIATGNRLGYVALLDLNDENLKNVVTYRAHLEAIEMLSISDKFRVVVSSGRDDEIRVWCLEDGAYIGELGKHRKWKLGDRSTWPKPPLEIDPTDFVGESTQEEDAMHEVTQETVRSRGSPQSERSSPRPSPQKRKDVPIMLDDDDDLSVYQPLTAPRFSAQAITDVLEELEEVCISGRDHAFDYVSMRPRRSETSRESVIPKKRIMCYEDFIPKQELEDAARNVRQLRATKFQRPFRAVPKKERSPRRH